MALMRPQPPQSNRSENGGISWISLFIHKQDHHTHNEYTNVYMCTKKP